MDAPPVQYVTTSDGWSIAYTVCGEGPSLIHMPYPWSDVQLHWQERHGLRRFREQLARRFTLVCYDGRGQGMSSRGLPEHLSLDDLERDLEAVLGRLRAEPFVLWGPALSGRVAIQYTAEHADRVEGLVLWNCSVDRPTFSGLLGELAREDWEGFLEVMARTMPTPSDLSAFKEMTTQADWLKLAALSAESSIEAVAQKVQTPTLILATRAAPFRHAESGKQLAALIPDARLVLFDDPGAGIYDPEAETVPAILAIESFLRDVGVRTAPGGPLPSHGLSAREVEVLRLIAAGKSNQQIAAELVITLNTVQHHVSNILTKTGLASRGEAAAYAHRNGLA